MYRGVVGSHPPQNQRAQFDLDSALHHPGGGGVFLLHLVHRWPLRLPHLPDQLQPDHQRGCEYSEKRETLTSCPLFEPVLCLMSWSRLKEPGPPREGRRTITPTATETS